MARKNIREITVLLSDFKDCWSDRLLGAGIKGELQALLQCPVSTRQVAENLLVFSVDLTKDTNPVVKGGLVSFVRSLGEGDFQKINTIKDQINRTANQERRPWRNGVVFINTEAQDLIEEIDDLLPHQKAVGFDQIYDFFSGTHSRDALLNSLLSTALNMGHSPFTHLGPVDPSAFVGRQDLIEEILHGHSYAFLIPGGRKIGKSSLLIKLKDVIENDLSLVAGYEPLFIDCSNIKSYTELTATIFKRLLPKDYFIRKSKISFTLEECLNRAGRLINKRVILLLDEMDHLARAVALGKSDGVDFYNALRATTNIKRLKVVIAGFREVVSIHQDANHPIFNQMLRRPLALFSEGQVKQLIYHSLSSLGMQMEDRNEIAKRIFRETSGHPSLVQFIGGELFRHRNGLLIDLSSLEEALNGIRLKGYLIEMFVNNHTPLERLICVIESHEETITLDSVQRKLWAKGINGNIASESKVRNALTLLGLNNILQEIQAHGIQTYRFLYPAMRSVIQQEYGGQERIERLIQEVKYGA